MIFRVLMLILSAVTWVVFGTIFYLMVGNVGAVVLGSCAVLGLVSGCILMFSPRRSFIPRA